MNRSDRTTELGPLGAFLAPRRSMSAVIAAVAISTVVALIGSASATIPTPWTAVSSNLPIWRILAAGIGILPALSMHSSLAALEQMTTPHHRRREVLYLAAMTVVCFTIFLASCAVSFDRDLTLSAARSLGAWLGLALIGGRFAGWQLSWILPTVMIAAMSLFGGGSGGDYAWWEFSAQAYTHVPSSLLSLALLGAGVLATAITNWRFAPMKRAILEVERRILRRRTRRPNALVAGQ